MLSEHLATSTMAPCVVPLKSDKLHGLHVALPPHPRQPKCTTHSNKQDVQNPSGLYQTGMYAAFLKLVYCVTQNAHANTGEGLQP